MFRRCGGVGPTAGVHYPRSTGEFQAWFGTDDDCLDYLEWLRWPGGFSCPRCAQSGGWAVADGGFKCGACGSRTAVTAGTLFDRRVVVTVWFTACWMFAAQKDGVSALSVQRALEIARPDGVGDAAPAALGAGAPGRDRLTGTVEVDETYIGGEEPGLAGGRAREKAWWEWPLRSPNRVGTAGCRSCRTIRGVAAPLRHRHVEPGARVITDGWPATAASASGYSHEPRVNERPPPWGRSRAVRPCTGWLTGKRWLLDKGSVDEALQLLNEFRFNGARPRRGWSSTRARLAVAPTVRYATGGHRAEEIEQLAGRRGHRRLDRPPRTGRGERPTGR